MSISLNPPVLSLPDPRESAEGSIDPLGLQMTYEHLAGRVYPFMTVRMSRPRFLTAIAAIARVCEGLEDTVASDGITPAWLVCEWYMVEGLVRRRAVVPNDQWWGIAGSMKVRQTIDRGRPLGAAQYLKTPKVFGFTGIYKTLAVGLQIVTDDIVLDDGGYELLGVWEREQGLDGFLDDDRGSGRGSQLRKDLRAAVEVSLRKGYTDRRSGWSVWNSIVDHLQPGTVGRREGKYLRHRVADDSLFSPRDPEAAAMRRELLAHLEKRGLCVPEDGDEAAFFREILGGRISASEELRERLRAIDAYEALCRPIEDALRFIFHLSTERAGAPVSKEAFAAHEFSKRLASVVGPATRRVADAFVGIELEPEVTSLIVRYEEVRNASDLWATVLTHHDDAQRRKPPDGKRPWCEHVPEGVVVRPQYRQRDRPPGDDSYVRDYRTSTASQFLQDLGALPR